MTARDDLVEAIRVACFEHPKAQSFTELERRLNDPIDTYDRAIGEPALPFRFEQTSDPSSFLVNGTFSVHDFEGDPEIPSDRHHLKWGVYIAGESGWLTGYGTREEAALAGWNEIMAAGQ